MRLSSPLEALSSAIGHAVHLAMSDVRYFQRDFSVKLPASVRNSVADDELPGQYVTRRPYVDEIEVRAMFSQTWGSTALGFGGIGGAAMTPAYTVVLQGPNQDLAVYFQGRFAYRVNARAQPADPSGLSVESVESEPAVGEKLRTHLAQFWADVASGNVAKRADAADRYGATTELGSLDSLDSRETLSTAPKLPDDAKKTAAAVNEIVAVIAQRGARTKQKPSNSTGQKP